MKPLTANVCTTLAKLIPRLATNHDGEVISTVRAMQRTLAGAGHDLHDLAAAVANEPRVERVGVRGERDHTDGREPEIFWEDLSGFERRRWLDVLVYEQALSDWEASFIDSIRRQFLDRGERMLFSPKQIGSLNRVLWKAVAAGVRP